MSLLWVVLWGIQNQPRLGQDPLPQFFPPSNLTLFIWLNRTPFLSCSKRLTGPKPLPLIRVVET